MAAKLLLVEDSLSIQTIVETTFVQAGFEVTVADDALEGLHKAQTWLPDIVLADASMPGVDGFQLCQRIRHSASGRQVPVVLLTSGFTAYDKAKGDRAGVTAHLAKPFEPHILLALVQQLVPVGRYPTSPSAPVASMPPRLGGDAAEASASRAQQYEESAAHGATRLSTERAEAVPVPDASESDLAAEILGDSWSEAVPPPHTAEASRPPETAYSGNDGVPPEAAPARHGTMASAESETVARHGLDQTLGHHLLQMLRESLEAQLAMTLTQLMPQILDTVRDVVRAQMPELLEVLLQQEIAKLKQAVAPDQHNA